MTQELKPRILVFGVGGAGGNAVNNMIDASLQGVEFIVANTDAQALGRSKAETRLQLGIETTGGLGAGAKPEIGEKAAEESAEEIRSYLSGANMVFIAAGMGGGTGTGAAPVIARTAKEMGILTIAVVTKPFSFEGSRRMKLAEDGLARIRSHVDTMIVVPNQNLFRIANDRTTFADAFRMADDVLYNGVRGITDLIVTPGLINLDFADVRAIMSDMGSALMGMGEASGETRALDAARAAIDNPLLDDITIRGARGILINITGGHDMTLFELDEAANEIRREADPEANIIIGSAFDTGLEGRIRVSVVAAGLDEAQRRQPMAPAETSSIRQPVAAPVAEEADTAGEDAAGHTLADAAADPPGAEEEPAAPACSESPEAEPAASLPVDPDRPVVIPRPTLAVPAREQAPPASLEADSAEAIGTAPAGSHPAGSVRDQTERLERSFREAATSGFASLFMRKRPTPQAANEAVPQSAAPAGPPSAAGTGDPDLEIPAFLRRSANN